jgi:hypothetical protein
LLLTQRIRPAFRFVFGSNRFCRKFPFSLRPHFIHPEAARLRPSNGYFSPGGTTLGEKDSDHAIAISKKQGGDICSLYLTEKTEDIMAWLKVENYWLGYSLPKKQFYFYYKLQTENLVHQFFPTPEEFSALADMFRNEGPIMLNTDGMYFVTAAEQIGENEPAP